MFALDLTVTKFAATTASMTTLHMASMQLQAIMVCVTTVVALLPVHNRGHKQGDDSVVVACRPTTLVAISSCTTCYGYTMLGTESDSVSSKRVEDRQCGSDLELLQPALHCCAPVFAS